MERTIQKTIPVPADGRVTVDVYGDADPGSAGLVVVPGVMSDAHTWRHVARAITAWPSVAVLNRRGRTPSSPLPRDHTLRTEVEDLLAVLDHLGGERTLFGWSYGGLIALTAATERPVRHVIAYEPVIAPFARAELPALRAAAEDRDWDRSVDIVNTRVSGFAPDHVQALRADRQGWSALRRLSEPLYAELAALNASQPPEALARRAERIDLIIGEADQGTEPYGTSFDHVRQRLTAPRVQVLPGQGHLAHVTGPALLARTLDALA
ncbi:alpha/beta hydrolase [Catenulispora sp. NF23]|uniref:alpha/beta fold hydrolase n=1 Tax=Catenulispora pinistramenti TaxID=2705254 RepID=UPI001BA7C64E|nr:alpha/beta hydrolase [Catenulispora pinistramenti]MBS2539464.1 alpha/beta hydrolase [Catenulispora pinistramenti]